MSVEQYSLVAHDWLNLEFIINDLASRVIGQELGTGSSPTFDGVTLTGLTASRLVASDGDKGLVSSDLVSWVTGTSNRVTVADDGDGTITLSGPQDTHTAATPTFAGLTATNAMVIGSNSAVFQPNADSITFFQVLDADGGTPIFTVDTTNERVGILTFEDPTAPLQIGNGLGNLEQNDRFTMDGRMRTNGIWIGPGFKIFIGGESGQNYVGFFTHQWDFIAAEATGNCGFNEISPETAVEITRTAPYLTLHNSTHEDSDGGRESRINFKGEQSGGEETTLARIEVGHDGVADNEKGFIDLYTNDGSDGDSPTKILRVSSTGLFTDRWLNSETNTFLGIDVAGADNLVAGGMYNTAVGMEPLYSVTTGSRNTAMGFATLYANTTGSRNTAIGYTALDANTTNSYNVAVGAYSLYQNDGSSNIAIGQHAGGNQTVASNRLFIDNQDRVSIVNEQTKSLIYGVFDVAVANQSLTINGEILGSYGAKLGDGGTTNYTQLASDGELTLVGTARVTVDDYITASGVKAPGAHPATFVEYGICGAWRFADQGVAANQEQVAGTYKLPIQMDKTVVPIFKIGWSANGVSPGNCEWQLEYLYISLNEDTTAAAQETLTATGTASSTSDGFIVTSFSGMDLPSATDQAMFFRITRLSAGGNDTIADDVELRGMLFTHTRNKLGAAT